MKLSDKTICALASSITGDGKKSPYRKGAQLVEFFNRFGPKDRYGPDFPTRGEFTKAKLNYFNDTESMELIFQAALDPRDFFDTDYKIDNLVDHLNLFLEFDGYELRLLDKKWRIFHRNNELLVECSNPYQNSDNINHQFIDEQIEKCNRKIKEGDFDGAITNSRSLLEAVLRSIQEEFELDMPEYDGKLPALYKEVQEHLNLSPSDTKLTKSLKQILSGLNSIVCGLSVLRNGMSDSHVVSHRPLEHHARLAVNTSKTLCSFLFATKEYQMQKKKRISR